MKKIIEWFKQKLIEARILHDTIVQSIFKDQQTREDLRRRD